MGTKATPLGWVPVDYGDAQISVPSDWVIGRFDCPGMYNGDGWIYLSGFTQLTGCPLETHLPANLLSFRAFSGPVPQGSSSTNIHRLHAYSAPTCGPGCSSYYVPDLKLATTATGPLAKSVLSTITYSPRAVALARGSSPVVPASWRRVSFGGISAAVPKSWPVETTSWGSCLPTNMSIGQKAVLFVSGTSFVAPSCPALGSSWIPVLKATDGLVIDPGSYGPLGSDSKFAACFDIHGLSVCPTATDLYGVLVAAVHLSEHAQPVAIEIGLAGNGMTARTILHSLRAG